MARLLSHFVLAISVLAALLLPFAWVRSDYWKDQIEYGRTQVEIEGDKQHVRSWRVHAETESASVRLYWSRRYLVGVPEAIDQYYQDGFETPEGFRWDRRRLSPPGNSRPTPPQNWFNYLGIYFVSLNWTRPWPSSKWPRPPAPLLSVRSVSVRVPYLLLLSIAMVAPTYRLWRWRHRRLRSKRGMCGRCGYDLRGSPRRCPECGEAAPPAAAAPTPASAKPTASP